MLRIGLTAMLRRRRWTVLLLLVAGLEACAAMILCTLTMRQEAALEQTMDDTVISCVITDANGRNQDKLHMPTGFVDLLCGLRHERGYYQDEFVSNVRAKASVGLLTPADCTMVCLLTPDSDYALTAAGGGSMTLLDGWDASVFRGDRAVCVIPQGFAAGGETLTVHNGSFSLKMQIIGTHTGPANCIYCPFHAMDFHDGMSYLIAADSCSFEIRDARRLEEAKGSLYSVFARPDPNDRSSLRPAYGVRINDELFQSTLAELRGNLRTLRRIIPVLLVIGGAVGFFAAYLSTRSRLREYAVMRCLGMTRGRVFRVTFAEQLALGLVGGVLGSVSGIVIGGGFTLRMLLFALGGIAAFLIGTALSVSRVTRINVMKLMKTEE